MSYGGRGHGHHGLPMHPSQSTTRTPMAPMTTLAPMAPMAPMQQPPPSSLSHHAPTHAPPPSIPGKNFDITRYPSPSAASKFVLSDPANAALSQDLANRMATASPEVVRHVVRNHFETICTGSEYHMYFILSVIMREASSDMLRTFIKEFGGRVARECSVEIASNWSAAEIDDLAPYILPRCGSAFLDRALETRFRTIPAQSLVNYLARAQRLGYEESDIVDNTTIPPMVVENNAPAQSQQPGRPETKEQTMAPTPRMSVPSSSGPLPSQASAASGIVLPPIKSSSVIASVPTLREEATKLGVVYCQHCDRPCSGKAALVHHNKKSPCVGWTHGVVGKDVCINCGQRFDGNGGLAYHTNHMVCGIYPENVTIKMEQLLRTAYEFANRRSNPDPLRPSYSTGSMNGSQHSPSTSAYITTPGSPTSDPYASLTMDQREALQKEIQVAENKFADRMKDAMDLPAPERDVRLANLKNGLNNKQSMIRKKYGIRLRGRRTRADMQAERDRMIGSTFPTVGRSGRRRSRSPLRAASMHLGSTAYMSQDRRRSVGSELSHHGRTGHDIISVDSTPSPPRRVTMGGDRFASPSPLASQLPSQAPSQADDMDRMEVDEASRMERAHRYEPEGRLVSALGSERGDDSHYAKDDAIRETYSGEPQQKRMRVDEPHASEHPGRRESYAEARHNQSEAQRSPAEQTARHEGETVTASQHAAQVITTERETERTAQHSTQEAVPATADNPTGPTAGADDDQMDISDSEPASSQRPKERDSGLARQDAPPPARAEGTDNETERRDANHV